MKTVHVLAFGLLLCSCGSTNAIKTDGDTRLRVLAYNIHHGEGTDEVLDLNRIARLINDLEPDLVAIQEVDSVVDRTNNVDQIAVLAELTGLAPAFGRFMSYQGGAYGMALLSRLPLIEVDNMKLPDGEEPRTALRAAVRMSNGDTLDFVGIHFYRTEAERLSQAEQLNDHLESRPYAAILAGDFNSTPGSAVMDYFNSSWTTVQKGDDRFTFPSTGPEREIDFVLYRPSEVFDIAHQFVVDEPVASDHSPIVVDFLVRRQ
ncbi:MAG: hypothetical protein HKN43_13410 [Rhodothermales bacterium]|nr:hypothetical protein [Rhodothermales bacterium]